MSKFEIKTGIESAISGTMTGTGTGKPLFNVDFLGIGGAFDTEEGTSSALLKTKGGKRFLIDCGYTSYSKLRKKELINKIDVVFITHCHEDHINGLSSFIYDRYYIHKLETIIECTEAVGEKVKAYLDICGHPEDQYIIYTDNNVFFQEERISVTKVDTTAHHWPVNGFPNSGLLFHFETEEDYVVLIYSGDINVPIINLMNPDDYSFVYDNPDNVFIFHDMTSLVHEQNPHTNYSLLEPVLKQFNNLYTYHHSAEQVALINQSGHADIASTSLIVQGESFVIEEKLGA